MECLARFSRHEFWHFLISWNPDFLELIFSMTSETATALHLKFVFVTSFLLSGQLRDLAHSKMTSELTYGTLNIMNIYHRILRSVVCI